LAGIGYAVAEACLESGARVTLSSSDEGRVASSIKSLKAAYPSYENHVSGYVCDLAEPNLEKEIENLFQKCGYKDHMYVFGEKPPFLFLKNFLAKTNVPVLPEHSGSSIC
jgi:NAD(P)-dependent dehydrogenase (short-subunit alcohol dehydrogenase family)